MNIQAVHVNSNGDMKPLGECNILYLLNMKMTNEEESIQEYWMLLGAGIGRALFYYA